MSHFGTPKAWIEPTTAVKGKRLQIDVAILREMLDKGEIHQFRWIDTQYQVANALTKQGANTDYLLSILRECMVLDMNTGIFIS